MVYPEDVPYPRGTISDAESYLGIGNAITIEQGLRDDVVFVALRFCGAFDAVEEIGVSILDTRDLNRLEKDRFAIPFENLITTRTYSTQTVNRRDKRDRVRLFGDPAQVYDLPEIFEKLSAVFRIPNLPDPALIGSQRIHEAPFRNVVLVGHGIATFLGVMHRHGFPLPERRYIFGTINTCNLFRRTLPGAKKHGGSLKELLVALKCPHSDVYSGHAGNESNFTLRALLGLVWRHHKDLPKYKENVDDSSSSSESDDSSSSAWSKIDIVRHIAWAPLPHRDEDAKIRHLQLNHETENVGSTAWAPSSYRSEEARQHARKLADKAQDPLDGGLSLLDGPSESSGEVRVVADHQSPSDVKLPGLGEMVQNVSDSSSSRSVQASELQREAQVVMDSRSPLRPKRTRRKVIERTVSESSLFLRAPASKLFGGSEMVLDYKSLWDLKLSETKETVRVISEGSSFSSSNSSNNGPRLPLSANFSRVRVNLDTWLATRVDGTLTWFDKENDEERFFHFAFAPRLGLRRSFRKTVSELLRLYFDKHLAPQDLVKISQQRA